MVKRAKSGQPYNPPLESGLGKIKVFLTENQLHAVELTRHALKLGAKTVISVGGDGTLNEVVNGFFEDGKPLNVTATLAIVSRGTDADSDF